MSHNEFDMNEYVRKRMLEITNLNDRKIFKDVVGDLLVRIYEYSSESYQELEKRILNEYSSKQSDYAVYISLTDMAHYDATDTFMYPMLPRDTKKTAIPLKNITKAIKNNEETRLYTVFYEANAPIVYQIVQENKTFKGVLKTDKREYHASFRIERNTEYMDMIKELYYIFGANYQPWFTVCEAYLTKMLDVYLCSAEPIKNGEEIVDIQVDFEECATRIKYNMIPLWNIQPLKEKTSTYPTPSIDKANYEHQIFSHRLKGECEYLIRNTDVEITNIRRLNGDLYITCPVEKSYEWRLYQVNKKHEAEQYLYPVLSNQYKKSFAASITEMFRKSIKTKGELARLIESFDYQDYVIFQNVHSMKFEDVPAHCKASNYNMDGFIQDEIRIGDSRQALVIDFVAVDPADFLNEDIMSFLVTQVQKIFPEYQCIGQLG